MLIACIRCGDLFEAEKYSFTRVYQDDGTFKYPRIDENQKRFKGKLYFKPMDLTGSLEGTAKKPKCSLLKFYPDQIGVWRVLLKNQNAHYSNFIQIK